MHFSVSSKHRQTKRYVNSLENTLVELKHLLNSTSTVVCHGSHHNHVIHPADPYRASLRAMASQDEEYGDYGDVYGESVLDKKPKLDSDGNWFFNVVPQRTRRLSEMNRASLRLSFNEDVGSVVSSSTSSRSQNAA